MDGRPEVTVLEQIDSVARGELVEVGHEDNCLRIFRKRSNVRTDEPRHRVPRMCLDVPWRLAWAERVSW